MSYKRKTVDTFQLWVNYGLGFEYEITEYSFKEYKERLKEYRENCPQYPLKLKRVRERITVGEFFPAEFKRLEKRMR